MEIPSMSSPPTLPISNPSPTASPPSWIATPALLAFLSSLSASLRRAFAHRRPWSEIVDLTAFSRPDTISVAASRVRKNFSYFRVNYLTLLAAVLAASLISHPISLIVISSLLAAWLFLYFFRPSDQPVTVLGREFSNHETLAVLVVLTVIVIFLTSVGSLLISATLIGLAIVCVHGAFRVPEDLFLDDQEPLVSGLFSFVSGATAPSVNSRV